MKESGTAKTPTRRRRQTSKFITYLSISLTLLLLPSEPKTSPLAILTAIYHLRESCTNLPLSFRRDKVWQIKGGPPFAVHPRSHLILPSTSPSTFENPQYTPRFLSTTTYPACPSLRLPDRLIDKHCTTRCTTSDRARTTD